MQQCVCAGVCLLLTADLDFQLLQVDVRVLLRVDGWPQSGVDCKEVSYTERKRGVKNASRCFGRA